MRVGMRLRFGLTCSLFTGEGQVIVAWNVVPLSVLVPDHDHAVLACGEEAVWLSLPPVLELLMEREKTNRLFSTVCTHTFSAYL